jgi:hypothetical protein
VNKLLIWLCVAMCLLIAGASFGIGVGYGVRHPSVEVEAPHAGSGSMCVVYADGDPPASLCDVPSEPDDLFALQFEIAAHKKGLIRLKCVGSEDDAVYRATIRQMLDNAGLRSIPLCARVAPVVTSGTWGDVPLTDGEGCPGVKK